MLIYKFHTFFLFIIIFPYTKMSLNKKNCLGLGFLRQILVNTPSPTNTRPGTAKGCKQVLLQIKVIVIY